MKRILDDISLDELMQMREAGMSNRDISNSLDIGYSTVYRLIGAQGGKGGRISNTIQMPPASVSRKETPKDDFVEGVLPVINKVIYLKGEYGEYSVDVAAQKVSMVSDDVACEMSFEKWLGFAAEVAAISRNIKNQHVSPEIW